MSGTSVTVDRCQVFRRLHQSGCFIIPNPWDLGSARALVRLGFPALATTSSGFAWSLGRRDNRVSLEEALTHMRATRSMSPSTWSEQLWLASSGISSWPASWHC